MALVTMLAGAVGCAHRPLMAVRSIASSCHQQVAAGESGAVTWMAPDAARDLGRLDDWCETVGPALVVSTGAGARPHVAERLVVVTWNVHVGGGDIEALIGSLRQGRFTAGRPVRHFVLLLQEAHREGDDVPSHIDSSSAVPRPITETPPGGVRRDVASVAARAGLHLFYAPAMRNGSTATLEDRGPAILATLPLAELQVIELPFERQRRIALAATVQGETAVGAPWRLRVADVHVDTSLALTRGGPVAARRRQTEALIEALAMSSPAETPTVVGGDFNTWFGSTEQALAVMQEAFPDTPMQPRRPTWQGPLGTRAALDHVFVRGRFEDVSTELLPDRFGSDHHPLVTIIDF
jgi:endonuclease/exonuclease/phosphatase family metal-dependent hydrolase